MISIPIEDLIFVLCTLVGGGLLLITVLVDDILGGIFDALHIGFDIGGVSLMPLLLGVRLDVRGRRPVRDPGPRAPCRSGCPGRQRSAAWSASGSCS